MPVRPKEVLLDSYKGSPDTLEGITFVIAGVLASMSRDVVRRGRKFIPERVVIACIPSCNH